MMKTLGLLLALVASPAFAQQQASPQQEMQQAVAMRLGVLEIENYGLHAQISHLQAENDRLEALEKRSADPKKP